MSPVAWIRVAAVLGALGVAMGAFGAHGLKERLDAYSLDVYQTAVTYQMYHVPALLAVGLLGLAGRGSPSLSLAGWSFFLGILIFSGTLYVLSLTGLRWLGAITPIGGLLLIVGWVVLTIAAGAAGRSPAVGMGQGPPDFAA